MKENIILKKEKIELENISIGFKGDTILEIPENQISYRKKYFTGVPCKDCKANTILAELQYKEKTFYVFNDKNQVINVSINPARIFPIKTYLLPILTKKNIYFFGLLFKGAMAKKYNFNKVYLDDKEIGIVKRLLSKFVLIKIPIPEILEAESIHSKILIGSSPEYKASIKLPTFLRNKKDPIQILGSKKIGEYRVFLRTVSGGTKIRAVHIKDSPEYFFINRLKYILARIVAKFTRKKLNLLFEKETNKASESGYYVFTKLIEYEKETDTDIKNYFVIDEDSPDYERIKKEYGERIIEKYSFRYYLYLIISRYFISSELSNGIVSSRFYIPSLNRIVNNKPLIFLQHGIMFAKPIENPAARGFWKDNLNINLYKSVVSSDLEAGEFYKVGYQKDDLIKCGLPKLDISKQTENPDKIVFMPTYRYWEEALVYDGRIKETTYYKLLTDIIEAFEKNDMLDELLIVPHPKFGEIVKEDDKYKDIITQDVAKALERAKIFITDYSSASFDAHYRGSYIIYYWAERDYLIENYQAEPPINENNCDGVPVFNTEQLIEEVKKAKERDYVLPEKYEKRFKKIIEFDDNRNAERLIEVLRKLSVI